ncbi:hypothetical protein M011DRAFT_410181, partial [Sporormia fimetaria CBS 119925]
RSKFFEAAMKKGWAEGESREILLTKESPETVRAYLNLVYSNLLLVNEQDGKCRWMMLAEIYVLAEFLQDVEAKNSIVCELY